MSKLFLLAAAAAASLVSFGFQPATNNASFTRDGVTYVQRGGLKNSDFVATNVDASAVSRVQSVNSKTGAVHLAYSDVGALPSSKYLTTTSYYSDIGRFAVGGLYANSSVNQEYFGIYKSAGTNSQYVSTYTNTQYRADHIMQKVEATSPTSTNGTFALPLKFPFKAGTIARTEDVREAQISAESYTDSQVRPLSLNTNVTFHVDGTDLIVRTNDVEVWHSWKSMQPAAAPVRRYALFLVHLNPNSSTHPFADIELKATTNNYYGDSMTFYCASVCNGDPARSGNPTWEHDWCRIYVLTSKVDSDVRRWKRIRNTSDLGTYNPRDLAIIVDPSAGYFRRGQGSEWCKESNDELIWSYVRITASGPEMDEGGTKQLWRPIMPVRWYTSLPAWANQASW